MDINFSNSTQEEINNFYKVVSNNRHLAKLICIPQQNHGQS